MLRRAIEGKPPRPNFSDLIERAKEKERKKERTECLIESRLQREPQLRMRSAGAIAG